MDITVTPAGGDPQPAEQPVPAAAGSPLMSLRAKRQEIMNKLHIDLAVPRWSTPEMTLLVRYRPINTTASVRAIERRQKSNADDWIVLSQIDTMIDSCVGIYAKTGGKSFTLGQGGADAEGNTIWAEFDPDRAQPDQWVGFAGTRSPELADALGLDLQNEKSKSVPLVRALYVTDGDLTLAYHSLVEWSSAEAPKADEEALGE